MRTRSYCRPLSISLLLAAMLLGVTCSTATAEEKTDTKTTVKQQKKLRSVKGRLPNYFRTVVTKQQRQEIYEIQKEYGPRIRKLKEQIKALIEARNAKIDAVLSPEQRKEIAERKQAAKAKRRKAKEKAAAESKAPKE